MAPPGFVAFCLELLASAGLPRARRMFGGHGLYVDDLFVGLVIGERLYLKADADSAVRFEAEGGEPFRYTRDGREMALGFWTPPAEAMESPDLMRPWVRLALQAALQTRAAAPRRTAAPARRGGVTRGSRSRRVG